jgi:hypothetical protein
MVDFGDVIFDIPIAEDALGLGGVMAGVEGVFKGVLVAERGAAFAVGGHSFLLKKEHGKV